MKVERDFHSSFHWFAKEEKQEEEDDQDQRTANPKNCESETKTNPSTNKPKIKRDFQNYSPKKIILYFLFLLFSFFFLPPFYFIFVQEKGLKIDPFRFEISAQGQLAKGGNGSNGSISTLGHDLKFGRVYFQTLNPKPNFVIIGFKS